MVIFASGPLLQARGARLSSTLRSCLADLRAAIILDLAAIDPVDPRVLHMLPILTSGEYWWPGTELILAAPPRPCAI